MKVTPNAEAAFEDYYAMGPERSLRKLSDHYEQEVAAGNEVPTKRLRTIGEWSSEFNWPQRIIDRVQEDAAEVREQMQERLIGVSKRVAAFVEEELTRLLERLQNSEGEILAESVADVERLTKLYYQIAGQPLADKVEHGGFMAASVVPLPIFGENDPIAQFGADEEGRELLCKLAEKRAALYEAARSGETPDALNPAAEDD